MRRADRPALALALLLACAACGGEADSRAGGTNPKRVAPDAVGVERAKFFEVLRAAERAFRDGDAAEAERGYREALRLRPDHEAALFALAQLRHAAGDYNEAVSSLETLRDAKPQLHRARIALADLACEGVPGAPVDLARAIGLYEEAVQAEPGDTGVWLRLGRAKLLAGDAKAARSAFATVLRSDTASLPALRARGELELRAGRALEAMASFREALRAGLEAAGRSEVPSEMDTAQSFVRAGAASARNVEALVGLARAARIAGWPSEVPEALRLPDLEVLGPISATSGTEVAAAGPGACWDFDGDGVDEVLLPAGAGRPVQFLRWRDGAVRAEDAAGLPGCGSLDIADGDGDGRAEIVLGGTTPWDAGSITMVRKWLPGLAGERTELPVRGCVVPLGRASPRPFVAFGRGADRAMSAWRVDGGAAAPASRLATGLFVDAALYGRTAVLLRHDGKVLRAGLGESPPPKVKPVVDAGRGATCLALADVDQVGDLDLVVGRAAPRVVALQALIRAPHDPFDSIVVYRSDGRGGFQSEGRPLPEVPAMRVRALARAEGDGRTTARLVAVCGDEEPGSFSPSFALVRRRGAWNAVPLPSSSGADERAFGVLFPRRWGDVARALVLRGGLCRGNRLNAALVRLP